MTQRPDPGAPRVTVVVVNLDGGSMLARCLDSVAALDYPPERVDVVVVDNGSTDGSADAAAERPRVQVLRQGTNTGFAPAVNAGAQASSADCLALLNNDVEVEPGWLSGLIGQLDVAGGFPCVGGLLLDRTGTKVDFADAAITWYGHGNQPAHGVPVADLGDVDGMPLAFACGGSLLIDRLVFEELGGFDATYFAYFEDVDLGWRLWLAGHGVRLAAGARGRHLEQGTASRFPWHQRAFLLEANALRTVIKNVGDALLPQVLAGALALAVERAHLACGSDPAAFAIGAADRRSAEEVERAGLAPLHAAHSVLADLDDLLARRRQVQLSRRRPDEEVLPRFVRPFRPGGTDAPPYLAASVGVARLLGLQEPFWQRPAARVGILAYDRIGPRMAGPAIRAFELARVLARHIPVTLITEVPVERPMPERVDVHLAPTPEDVIAAAREVDILIVQGLALRRFPALRTSRALLVVDLYDPWAFENLEFLKGFPADLGDASNSNDVSILNELIDAGDAFVCASERQRDYWLGMLTARGRIDLAAHAHDPTLRTLIDVVSFGCPEGPPAPADPPVLRGRTPAIGRDDKVILWGGGTWDWFDPLLVVDAFTDVLAVEPRARLYFMGMELDGRDVPQMSVTAKVVAKVEALGLRDTAVAFGGWVPYDDRGLHLLEADVGVVATRDLAESRLAFRTRVLDHFWTGLPTVTTSGDILADLVESSGAGLVVAPGDRAQMAEALLRLLTDDDLAARARTAALGLAERFRWPNVAAPLVRIVEEPWRWEALHASQPRPLAMTEDAWALERGRQRRIRELEADLAGLQADLAERSEALRVARHRIDTIRRLGAGPVVDAARWARHRLRNS